MGLAAYGDPEVFRQPIRTDRARRARRLWGDPGFLGFPVNKFEELAALLGPPRRGSEVQPRHADFAAALQEATNAAVLALVRRLKRQVPFDNLCVAGGVALNCVTNEMIRQSGDFSEMFIPSAPHDAGTAIGAALAVHCAEAEEAAAAGQLTPYLGPRFDAARDPGGGQGGRSDGAAQQDRPRAKPPT